MVFGEFFNAFNIANLTYATTPTLKSSAFGSLRGEWARRRSVPAGRGPFKRAARFTF
jgi:hypothetical protein